jgi:hypothetical protein
MKSYLKKPFIKKGLVEWLKVKALSSTPSIEKTKQNKITTNLDKVKGSIRGKNSDKTL